MPVTKSELISALKDPSVQNYLRSFLISTTSSESIGRYPGNGSAQNDIYVYPDAADASFPYNFDYVLAQNFQRLISAKLSFKIRAYRTYSSLSLSNTGNASVDHTHATGGETGHSHSHNHSVITDGNTYVANLTIQAGGLLGNTLGGAINAGPTTTNAAGSSGHDHGNTGGQSVSHSHSVSGTTTLGIAEDTAPVNPGITVSVDGVNVTAALGGPFNSDQVEIDATRVLPTTVKMWHTVALQPNQRVRITGILRISYYVDNRVAI